MHISIHQVKSSRLAAYCVKVKLVIFGFVSAMDQNVKLDIITICYYIETTMSPRLILASRPRSQPIHQLNKHASEKLHAQQQDYERSYKAAPKFLGYSKGRHRNLQKHRPGHDQRRRC